MTEDYLGYCRHGILVYWSDSKFRPTAQDYRDVFEMRRGSVETARKEMASCPECKKVKP